MLCVAASSCWQMVPRQPARQAAPQCSLNATEACANAFSPWPLLFYLIIQNSVNLNLIAVCHGEAHRACVGQQLLTMRTAAGPLLCEAHLEPQRQPTCCLSQPSVLTSHRFLNTEWKAETVCFFLFFFASPFQIPSYEEALGLMRSGRITRLSNASLLIITLSLKILSEMSSGSKCFWQVHRFTPFFVFCWYVGCTCQRASGWTVNHSVSLWAGFFRAVHSKAENDSSIDWSQSTDNEQGFWGSIEIILKRTIPKDLVIPASYLIVCLFSLTYTIVKVTFLRFVGQYMQF